MNKFKVMYQDSDGWHFIDEPNAFDYDNAIDKIKELMNSFGYSNLMIVRAFSVDAKNCSINIKVKE